ncbi:MAG: orotidine 5'-phosphate decarboxylase [Fusobacteriia bacterium 4572_132]|nr:MAG: orotidine 5'-phosphate decarboxylase [Fusobacteriia bacterium 4572_132]
MKNLKEKLVLALDVPNLNEAKKLIQELAEYVGVFKVGKELFTAVGPEIFKVIKENGGKIFADLKYHDIPNTVASAARVLTRQGVEIFNIHATGGREMIRQTREAIEDEANKLGIKRPKLLAVTVLTSLDNKDLKDLKINVENTGDYVLHLAKMAKESGVDGIVCSPLEIEKIKKELGNDFITLTPGIRPSWASKGDQKRVMTPKEATKKGGDYIVIGRPIRNAENRVEATKKILEEMGEE